jgi:hypothetical protein
VKDVAAAEAAESETSCVRTGPPAAAARRASAARAWAEPTSRAEVARLGQFPARQVQ